MLHTFGRAIFFAPCFLAFYFFLAIIYTMNGRPPAMCKRGAWGNGKGVNCIKWKLKKTSDKNECEARTRLAPKKIQRSKKPKKRGAKPKSWKKRNTKQIIFIINDYGLTLSGLGLQLFVGVGATVAACCYYDMQW